MERNAKLLLSLQSSMSTFWREACYRVIESSSNQSVAAGLFRNERVVDLEMRCHLGTPQRLVTESQRISRKLPRMSRGERGTEPVAPATGYFSLITAC